MTKSDRSTGKELAIGGRRIWEAKLKVRFKAKSKEKRFECSPLNLAQFF